MQARRFLLRLRQRLLHRPRSCATSSRIAETGFDPAQISDLYSRIVTAHMFEALYKYDYLARPFTDDLATRVLGHQSGRAGRLPDLVRPGLGRPEPRASSGSRSTASTTGSLPDGPERLEAIRAANKLLLAYAPMKYSVHRVAMELVHPWLLGYRRPPFGNQWWHYVDIDAQARAGAMERR
jgi:hypothetical protein